MALLKATAREAVGTREARALRRDGKVPGVVYGHGQSTRHVALNRHDLDLAIHHGERLLEIELDGQSENVLVKEVQWDTYGHEILHIDLARVNLDERVTVTVPVVLRGTPAGVNEGGVLQQAANEVSVECAVRAMPDELRAVVSDMNVGDALHLKDLDLPDGVVLSDDPDMLLCSVTVLAEEEEEAPAAEEGAAEPEVVGEKKESEEAAEGEGQGGSE